MCLSKIEKVYDPPDMDLRKGWKACEHLGKRRIGAPYYSAGRGLSVWSAPTSIKRNRWYKAVQRQEVSTLNQAYNTGFHIFVTDSDAHSWGHYSNCMKTVVVPVWYVSTRIAGTQDRATCHVADWIYYCSGPDHGEPPPLPSALVPQGENNSL
jgi:hypothetical protein